MTSISHMSAHTCGIFYDLHNEFHKKTFVISFKDQTAVRRLKHFGNTCKQTIISLAMIVSALAIPVFFLMEITVRAILLGISKIKRCYRPEQPKTVNAKIPTDSMISYNLSGGRFGDSVLDFLHAKWLSYKYKLPLCFKPFEFSDKLGMHDIETVYDLDQFYRIKNHRFESNFTDVANLTPAQRKRELTLHSINHFPESPSERGPRYRGAWVDVDWNDPGFKQEMKKVLQPKVPLNLIVPPQDKLSVAIHWRTGSGGDGLDTKNYYPCKIPPEQFYLDQVVRLCKKYPSKSMYLHLFTDDKHPSVLEDKIRKVIVNAGIKNDIVFGKNPSGPRKEGVLEDFFSMTKFNCMIRSESAFSIAAQLLGDHQLVISPSRFHTQLHSRDNGELIIDQIIVTENGRDTKEDVNIRFPMYNNPDCSLKHYTRFHRRVFGI